MIWPASLCVSTMVRKIKPGPPEPDKTIPAVPALKLASVPAHRDKLVPAVLFSNVNFKTECTFVSTGIPVTRYLPVAPTEPVIVSVYRVLLHDYSDPIGANVSYLAPIPSARAETFLDDRESSGGDRVSGQQAARNPGGAAGIVGGAEGSAGDAADIVDQDVVIFGGSMSVTDDALEDFEYLERLDFQAGLFADLTYDSLFQCFARFEYSAGE
jgi:hypothetical protein